MPVTDSSCSLRGHGTRIHPLQVAPRDSPCPRHARSRAPEPQLLFSRRFGTLEESADFDALHHAVEFFFCKLASGNPSDLVPCLRVLPNPFLTLMAKETKKRDAVLGPWNAMTGNE